MRLTFKPMLRHLGVCTVLISGLASPLISHAMPIVTAETISIVPGTSMSAGDTYTTEYTISNPINSGVAGVTAFSIYFDVFEFTGITATNTPAGWDVFIDQPDSSFFLDGFVDYQTPVPGTMAQLTVENGEAQGPFTLSYTFLGMGSEFAGQFFEVYDPVSVNIDILGNGGINSNVPEPTAFALLAIGIAAFAGQRRLTPATPTKDV